MVKRSITTDPNAVKATLPIEWTQLKKRGNERAESNESESCCEDLLCCRTRHQSLLSAEVDTSKDEENFQGQAIFCMHKIDPEWFQGYFLVQGQTKPWGLLAIQEAIDKCLQCTDGGYRQISLTVMPYQQRQKVTWKEIDWTGGDMIKLRGQKMSFEPERCLSGSRAVPFVEKYFRTLITKLQNEGEGYEKVLDVAPNVAIVIGNMKVIVPKQGDDDKF